MIYRMTSTMYNVYRYSKKVELSHQDVIDYINSSRGLLGTITKIVVFEN